MLETLLMLLWAALAFLLGALPFSVWVGRLAGQQDIRSVGDKNPGATNVLRSAGFLWFSLAMLLDISKAAAPIGLAYQVFDWRGWPMWLIAMAPVAGHAISPFLGWKGGKAVATAFGAWIGLTLYTVPAVSLVALVFWFGLITISGWAIMLALLTIGLYLLMFNPDPLLLAVLVGQIALLGWTHRADLAQRPSLRPRWLRLLGREQPPSD
jgi:glycerol-3-phosphate acyltransferase PlsY